MFSSTGIPTLSSEWTNWHLLFTRQAEPDLEFSDEDLDQAVPPPAPPMNAPKRSGKKPLLWIFLLVVAGGMGYVAMDPDGAMQFIEPYLDGGTEKTQPLSRTSTDNMQAPTVIPPELSDKGPSSPPETTTPPLVATPATPSVTTAPPFAKVAGPRFSEGQRVTVIPDTSRPTSSVPLFVNPAGPTTRTTVQADAMLTILDGDYQNSAWVYAVRTDDGREGWIPERELKLTR